MFFDKILDFFKIENLYGNNKDNGSDATLHIYDLIKEAQDLATVINTTTDETTFYGSYEALISILCELEKYEDIVPFVNKPSDDLKNVLANKEKAIEKFIMRSNQNVNNKPEKSILRSNGKVAPTPTPTPTPTDCATIANVSIIPEENINSNIKDNSSSLPYKSDRILINGLHPLFISVLRDILETGKVIPVSLMREYHLSKDGLYQIIQEAQNAHLLDLNNNILVSKDYFEKFIDHYDPSIYKFEHGNFDKELLICIGEITIENGAESLYEEFDPDCILDYLNILEKIGTIAYNSKTNKYDVLESVNDFINKCNYIPDTLQKEPTMSLDRLDHMEGHDFEYFCADLLVRNSYNNVEVTKDSGDHGIDILAEKDDITYAIQCKCYSSNIGNAAIQQAHTGKSIYHKDIAVVLTNQYFTAQAQEEANALGVKLWDRDKLQDLIEKAQ